MMSGIWLFIQNELLGMQWLNRLIQRMLQSMGMDVNNIIFKGVNFFLYDVIKIMVLLVIIIWLISYIQSFFPQERIKQILSKFNGFVAVVLAALLGTVTPFCSCSSIPIFIGFTNAGLPLNVTFSFLISSPMVDIGSIMLLMSIFGWNVALGYVVTGLLLAIFGGLLIGALNMESQIEPINSTESTIQTCGCSCQSRLRKAWIRTLETAKYIFPYVLMGVGIGAFIHNWIPEEYVIKLLGENNVYGVLIAVLFGIPMYADIFGCIPIAEALLSKGAGLGVVLSFMMAVTTLSLPSMIMLKKVIKMPLLTLFVGICTIGIIIIGYVFNVLQGFIM